MVVGVTDGLSQGPGDHRRRLSRRAEGGSCTWPSATRTRSGRPARGHHLRGRERRSASRRRHRQGAGRPDGRQHPRLRAPEPYKGKGIRYKGEHIHRKAGKAGKVGGEGRAEERPMTQVASRGPPSGTSAPQAGDRHAQRAAAGRLPEPHHIYAQLIDDASGLTLASASSRVSSRRRPRGRSPRWPGRGRPAVAERAQAAGIKCVVFDRGGFRYHGRVEGAGRCRSRSRLEF